MMYFVLKTGVYEWKGMETIMYKCCIFDLDGTLVNSIYAIQRSVNLSLEKWGMRQVSVDVLLARDVSKRIEDELEYPGQIKVNVIRESRVTDYAK